MKLETDRNSTGDGKMSRFTESVGGLLSNEIFNISGTQLKRDYVQKDIKIYSGMCQLTRACFLTFYLFLVTVEVYS